MLVGCRRRRGRAAHRRLRYRARHPALEEDARSSRSSTGSTRAPRWPAASASAFRSSSASRACSTTRSPSISALGRGSRFSVEVPLSAAVPASQQQRVAARGRSRANSPASPCCASTTISPFSTAWRRCSAAGAAACSRRPISTRQSRPSRRPRSSPDGLLVDYHLDDGNGIEAIAELRRRFGADLTAILITADRSPRVREDARAHGIQVLNKPIKPAALRALLTQWRVQRVAAAE